MSGKIMTTTHVDLDLVLTVAGELRRLCQRAVKADVRYPVFKQDSWEAALVHVQDVHAGRQPSIRSDGPFYRLLACCPRPAWRWEHLESLQAVRVFDGREENQGLWGLTEEGGHRVPYTFEVLDTSIPVWRSTPEEEIDVVAQYGTQLEVIFKLLPDGNTMVIRKVTRAEARRHPTMDDLEDDSTAARSGPGADEAQARP